MSPRPRVDLDQVAEKCTALQLIHVAETLPELLEHASREDMPPIRFLEFALEREIERKTERRTATSLKLSGLPTGKTLEGFDGPFSRASIELSSRRSVPAPSCAAERTCSFWAHREWERATSPWRSA